MSDAVVIQWARLGDVLQTRALLERLQRTRPESRRILCADARYADLIRHFPEKFEFWPVNLRRWSSLARHSSSHGELLGVIANECDVFRDVREPDTFVLTKSRAAAVFAGQLRPRRQYGYQLRKDEIFLPAELVTLETALRRGTCFPVHIADLWAAWANAASHAEWLSLLKRDGTAEKKSDADLAKVGVFCDAGESHRSIPASWLAELVRDLTGLPVEITLFAATSGRERDELAEISALSPSRVQDRRGKTPLGELIRMVGEQRLVLGADSGGLHLAASLDVPVIGLYFGGAVCAMTGPYAPNAVVIQNPIWDDTHRRAIVNLAYEILSSQRRMRAETISVMRPVLDRYGIWYRSERESKRGDADVEDFRSRFFAECSSLACEEKRRATKWSVVQ